MINICIILVLFLVVVFLFFLVFYFLLIKTINTQKSQLDQAKQKLQSYLARIDSLTLTLTDIHKFSLNTTGVSSRKELAEFIVNSFCKFFNAKKGSITFIEPGSENVPLSESMISMPIEIKGRIIGTINIELDESINVSDDKNLHLLTILTDQVAVAFENMELYTNLQNTYLEMVESLAKSMDAKDSYTYDHADRARKYARAICKELALPEGIAKHIEYAALIHDIGKIGIDNTILEKPGKLTQEERKLIEQHPVIGAKIVEPFAFLAPVAPMIRYHQEWYNGMGYPQGLKGEEIPLGSRIVSIIDSFDAMTSNRPYRKAMTKEQAIEELKRCGGTQFDTVVVEAFLRTLVHEEKNA
ncbi:MAG: hypothetical protein A3J83_03465 [Elusimicrobia bacterium RIFOXYA2_FULL_40_6]|nr:MAG: hypothetical protein A3J83_03465 [Elusimicrobia bacterium RIFOXYA2_FULL_40_6]